VAFWTYEGFGSRGMLRALRVPRDLLSVGQTRRGMRLSLTALSQTGEHTPDLSVLTGQPMDPDLLQRISAD
jgi:hypothetical protein